LFAIKKGIAKDLPIQATKIEHILIQSIKKTAIVLNKNIKGGGDMKQKFIIDIGIVSKPVLAKTIVDALSAYCGLHDEVCKAINATTGLYLEKISVKKNNVYIHLFEETNE
jgi:hypothetical protein